MRFNINTESTTQMGGTRVALKTRVILGKGQRRSRRLRVSAQAQAHDDAKLHAFARSWLEPVSAR